MELALGCDDGVRGCPSFKRESVELPLGSYDAVRGCPSFKKENGGFKKFKMHNDNVLELVRQGIKCKTAFPVRWMMFVFPSITAVEGMCFFS